MLDKISGLFARRRGQISPRERRRLQEEVRAALSTDRSARGAELSSLFRTRIPGIWRAASPSDARFMTWGRDLGHPDQISPHDGEFLRASFSSLVRELGAPTLDLLEGDSLERLDEPWKAKTVQWFLEHEGRPLLVEDHRATSLWREGLPSAEDFRLLPMRSWRILRRSLNPDGSRDVVSQEGARRLLAHFQA